MDFRRKNIDLVGKINLWFGISLALIVIGMVSLALFKLNLGIDFKGGGQFQYRIPYSLRPQAGQEVELVAKARAALEAQGLRTQPQITGGDALVITTDAKNTDDVRSQEQRIDRALASLFQGGKNANGQPVQLASLKLGQEFVGPIIGDELKRNAITGVLLGVSLIALWIYIRYNFAGEGLRYAVAGISALIHDVLVLVGIFALIGYFDRSIEINGAFIAALLTVVGYSINDSVVIFDRLRENLRLRRKEPFETVINDSLLETMSRSINTGMTVLIMLFSLLLFGGESIYNFVLAMLIGIAAGLYSSIFNASMVLVAWHRWDEKKAAQERLNRGAVTAPRRTSEPNRSSEASRTTTPNRPSLATAGPATTPTIRRGSFASSLPTTSAATPISTQTSESTQTPASDAETSSSISAPTDTAFVDTTFVDTTSDTTSVSPVDETDNFNTRILSDSLQGDAPQSDLSQEEVSNDELAAAGITEESSADDRQAAHTAIRASRKARARRRF
jgi:preprotein translocase subunit SecF